MPVFLIVICCASALAYTRITASSGEMPKWSSMPVSFWINEKGFAQITNGSEFAAVHASFQTWERVSSADVRFTYRGMTDTAGVGRDGMNIVSFADAATPLGSSTLAATFSFFKSELGADNQIHLVIDEADILFNPAIQFSTSADEGKYDIQGVLTHEIGHLLGLDHSSLISSVMVPFGVVSQLDQRTLAYDDIAGISEIYPKTTSTPVGRIQGTIRSGNIPVFGASVVAINADGTPTVSTLSQPDGTYTLRFLPPGAYRVSAEPLDLPVAKESLGGGTNGYFSNVRTDFGTTYFGNVASLSEARTVNVTANGNASADIAALPKNATGLNITRPAFAPRVSRGGAVSYTLGGEELVSGVSFTSSNPGIFLGTPTFGGRVSTVASTSARMEVALSAATPLGPKNITVTRGADTSILMGALVVTDSSPASITIAPANGTADGGTPVTVRGTNFRSGAQVYFGGLAASGVSVVDSGTILATTPQNSPGSVNVVVVNSDGTWGAAVRGFTNEGLPPVITRVTPSSGPPATLITIEGDNFDSLLQNVGVYIGTTAMRVITAAPKTITAIVPYGANTGPITVTIFGRPVTGPTFTVTTATASNNLATGGFNFIDASVAAGGSLLTFANTDDAIAPVPLPFNFSLFRDIYLAGSPVSVATNGFISLESLASAEFQNGPLPGQTVTRPSGTTGATPPSLIAPFWDDLVMTASSSITMRTVGEAPNRRFTVQWSNMSLFDEAGNDQEASLTFEVVLFEGSNDIQFLYQSMSGPRSDGSSATIGFQDLRRTTAVQTSFNQATVSSEYARSYHFEMGGYTELPQDTTPPSKPIVSDEGVLTANRTQLAASWTAVDPESGIREFQYAIGTTPGATDLMPYTSTTQNSMLVTGLSLPAGTAYYFAVKAINRIGLTSEPGVSDGIRYDPAYQPQIKIIASAPETTSEFSGLALLASTSMTVVLRAYNVDGSMILGPGIRNPSTVSLAAGQQYAKLLPELLGLETFDGWIEAEASAPGLGIFTATGAWDTSSLDGSVARETSADFALFHTGGAVVLVNPSSRAATVTMSAFGNASPRAFSIPSRGRLVTTVTGGHVQSSEPLAAVEQAVWPGKLAINAAVPLSDAASTVVFPHAVIGAGYSSTLMLVNASGTGQQFELAFAGRTTELNLGANASLRLSLGEILQMPLGQMTTGAVYLKNASLFGSAPGILAVMDIENERGLVTMGSRPAAIEFTFPHLANGYGLFTGLALAAGSAAAQVTIDVYEAAGGSPKSATVTLGANQQIGKLVSELVSGVATQVGGYIRVRSDQPIWAWEIYGSGEVMASGPPL